MRFLVILMCLNIQVFAQINFEKTYGLFQQPEMYFIEPLDEGGYIISGKCLNTTDSTSDFCFMKTDQGGNVIWTKQYDDQTFSPGNVMNEWASTIRQLSDGSFVFGGCVDDPNYNSAGAYYGWMDSSGFLYNSIIKTTSWATSVNSLMVNSTGNIISTRDDNMGAGHHANQLEINSSSAIFISGSASGDFSVGKQTLVPMPDGGYGGIGLQEVYYFDPDFNTIPVVTRFDANGLPLWNYLIHREAYSGNTRYVSICSTPDTGLLAIGYVETSGKSILLTRFNSAGDSLWSKILPGLHDEYPSAIHPTNDGGFAITGTRSDDILLLRLDANCNVVWEKTFGGSALDKGIYFQVTDDNGFAILAYTESFANDRIMIIKTDENGSTITSTTTTGKVDPAGTMLLYPDPFLSSINIFLPSNNKAQLTLIDVTGRVVHNEMLFGENNSVDLSFLPAGAYYAVIPGNPVSKKIIKQ